jgi:hypothetical protein
MWVKEMSWIVKLDVNVELQILEIIGCEVAI